MVKTDKVLVGTSTYTNKEGQEKSNWFEIGKVVTKDDGKKFFAFSDVMANYLKPLFGNDWNGIAGVFKGYDPDDVDHDEDMF